MPVWARRRYGPVPCSRARPVAGVVADLLGEHEWHHFLRTAGSAMNQASADRRDSPDRARVCRAGVPAW